MKVAEEIQSLVPYQPGKPISETQREYNLQKVVKLASNENPLGCSPKVQEALQNHIQLASRYPDPSCFELIQTVEKKFNISAKKIAIGNGSNEIIDLLIRIYCQPGDHILTSEIAFQAYQICAQAARVKTLFSPLATGFKIDLSEMTEILTADFDKKIKLVFIPNPNNPTGTYVDQVAMNRFISRFGNDPDRLLVFDEAYTEYVRASDYESALKSMPSFSSVVVIRTLSKAYGLAGLRVGILFAQPEVIDLFNRVRNPFNVNEFAQVAAIAALNDEKFVLRAVKLNGEGLDYFYKQLSKMGLPFVPSEANFILFDTKVDAKKLNLELLKKGVILRPVGIYGLHSHLRMSVGLVEENHFAIETLAEILTK